LRRWSSAFACPAQRDPAAPRSGASAGESRAPLGIMYKVYILKSLNKSRYYIGHTENLENRLLRHDNGKVKSTKFYRPWKLVHEEGYDTKSEAYKRELEIKSYKGGIKFKKLLGLWKVD